jgi:hypothetical protein
MLPVFLGVYYLSIESRERCIREDIQTALIKESNGVFLLEYFVGNNPATSSDGTRGSVVLAGGQGREA